MPKLLRLICCIALSGLAACARIEPPETEGRLVVAIREAPAFFQEREGATASGFEHDLVTAFADSLGLKAHFIKAGDPYELNDLALSGRVHFAASMPLGNGPLQYSAPIRTVRQWIVGHDDVLGPKKLADLAGKTVEVLAGSALVHTLRGLDEASPVVAEVPGANEMDLLARVAEGRTGLVAVHDVHLDLGVNFYPELSPLLQLPGKLELGWAFGGKDAASLRDKADAFIAAARATGMLARLHDRYFGHIKRINAEGIARFLDDARTRLPQWRRYFQSAQDLTGIDWRLIAALAYQESHWDPLATSYTNVRGMMMLTEDTADYLRVGNRLDAQESIRAGARYLAELAEQMPGAKHPDRLWLALAAYNLGMGHFRGARWVAKNMKRDPDVWYEMKQVLPQLARPEIYARLKSGPARGGEAVIMVENIRNYYDVLSRFEAAHESSYTTQAMLKPSVSSPPQTSMVEVPMGP